MTWREDIDRLSEAIDAIARVDAGTLPAHEQHQFLLAMNRQQRRLDHARHQATSDFEVAGSLPEVGYRTLAEWHRDQLGLSTHEAGKISALARSLTHVPTVSRLWAEGDIGAQQARAVASLRTNRTTDAFDRDEAVLAGWSADMDHHDLRTALRRWRLAADPDGSDPASDLDAHVSTTFAGGVRADATLDAIGGAAVKDLFDDIVEEFFRADWADATARLGREPTADDLARTAKQRRHDAFVEMATRARAWANGRTGRPRPLVTVVAGLEALANGFAELWDGTPLSAEQLAALLADDPDIQRFTYGADEEPIAYSPRARVYTGKLREAILTRDRRCTGRGCVTDTRRGAVDHIHPVSEGGPTTPVNGRGTCHPCNCARPKRTFRHHRPPHDPDPP